ncbi:MAG: DNA primase [Clostridiales Family XIII bacterium]|nr:DNA primase [Clostridiales Family XIII bacterium]
MSRDANIVELIKEKADIVETVGRIVPLRRSGRSWSGLCPFHKETDGSFHVYDDSGHFICFGCGVKGDVITFYEKYYNLSFLDACERLAAEYGIDWRPGGSFTADSGKEPLFEANRFAGSVYYEAMKQEGNPALVYLLGRGIDRRTVSKFRIGYADDSGRMLSLRLENDAALRKSAEEVGLVYQYSGRLRDRFEGRVMFPIVNTRGKVIGFGGRDISGKAKAKYINSAASNVYAKGSNLYGLNMTQGAIREQGFAILVEGYMDLVALYMHGVTNVCAQLGTAFTPQQAKLLGKYTKTALLALDSDESGQNAALKSMDILAEAGLKVRVLVLEGAKDPDEFIRGFGREAFDEAARNAVPMYDFKLGRMKREYDLTASDGLADFLKAAAVVIAPLSPVEQDYYVKKLSRESGISESAIALQAQGSRQAQTEPMRAGRAKAAPALSDELYRGILGLALRSASALEKAAAYRHLFEGTGYGAIMNAMLALKERSGAVPAVPALAEMLDEADQAVLDLIAQAAPADTGGGGQVREYLIKLELAALGGRESEIARSEDFASGDTDAMKELMEIQAQIKLLENDIRNRK